MRCSNGKTCHKNGREYDYIRISKRRKGHFLRAVAERSPRCLCQRPWQAGERRRQHVWYTLFTAAPSLQVAFISVRYDDQRPAQDMGDAGLPEAFVDTVPTGWRATCLAVLPGKERMRGRW